MIRFLILPFLIITQAYGATVAIIDSGTDMRHQDIAPFSWENPNEIPNNDRDEDGNGYQDDIYGWNFAEGNGQVIDYRYLGSLTQDIRRFFNIQTAIFHGEASDADIQWMRSKIEEEGFIKEISIYGNFMHGTHVGGIAIKDSPNSKLMAIKLIPTEVKLPGQESTEDKGLGVYLLKKALGLLAKEQMKMMVEISTYANDHKVDIANGSFGTGYPQAKMIVETLAKKIFKNITEEEVAEVTKHFLNSLIKEGKAMMEAAPKTLFVFASGNDGLNNDEYPTSPTNVQADNVISVAATFGRLQIAPFSNYGIEMVDVAAPGVGIESAVPGDKYLKVSGTSQAAPYVANVALKIKNANPKLTPLQVKKILMKTVDIKTWLAEKVSTKGIVNPKRAARAAELSLNQDVETAINMASQEVRDIKGLNKSNRDFTTSIFYGTVLPLPSTFVLRK
jgi:cell wall-associated protease